MSDIVGSDIVGKAWDSLPAPKEETDGSTCEVAPEVAALRALFGQHAFRLLGNAGIENATGETELAVAIAIQEHIANAYLFAIDAARSRTKDKP